MAIDEKRKKVLLASARIRINFSVTIMVLSILIIYLGINFPNPIISTPTKEVVIEEILPDYSVDPSEIVNGIHVPSGLIANSGFEIVLNLCSKCHSIDLVTQNRASKEGWKEMITWMQKTQGLWDLGVDEAPILAYLSKNYAPRNTGRRKNLENIEWYELKDFPPPLRED